MILTKLKQKENWIWALGLSIILCMVIGIAFDCYYDLNDDVVMKDILAGVYTGTPAGHNIQMLYPVSFFISIFYRVARGLPWYGLFLCLCQFGSILLVTQRLLTFIEKRMWKAVAVLLEAGLILSLFLWELVFVQYTVTCTMLGAAAAFLFYTSDIYEKGSCTKKAGTKTFWLRNLPSILLVTLAYQIRSEMLLLIFPLICVTGLCKWAGERPFFTRKNAAKYLSVFAGIIAGLLLSQGVHMVAYGSAQWRQFNRFFDNRTELYDFLGIPPYEGNEAFYESVGLDKSEQILLKNYNFGLDEEIDDELLGRICDYADGLRREQTSFGWTLKSAVKSYLNRLFDFRGQEASDYPWNLCIVAMYVFALMLSMYNGHYRFLWELPCMACVRTGLWLYILYRGRDPQRITHSLYLMEFVILIAFLVAEWGQKSKKTMGIKGIGLCLAALLSLSSVGTSAGSVSGECKRREEVNAAMEAFRDFAAAHKDNFYFIDVYSTVAFSEKMFINVDNSPDNYDIMGGWASKSPLMREKYSRYNISEMEYALIQKDNVYIVVESHPSGWIPDIDEWLPAYYAGHGRAVQLCRTDSVLLNGEAVFDIYKLVQE